MLFVAGARRRPGRGARDRRHQLGARRRRRRAVPLLLQTGRERRQLGDLRGRRQQARHRRLRRGAHPGRAEADAARTCSRRRWRSRTSASTSTAASTKKRSSAPRSRTSKPGEAVEGGSTITQQLVRNLCIPNPEDDLERKIIEAKLAIEYAKRHSKGEILGQYLNTASYGTIDGSTAVGVQAASRIYFSKPVWKLDLRQAALLAGLPQAPTDYNPILNPAGARERRDEVLAKMAELGFVSGGEARAAEEQRPRARRLRGLLQAPPALLLRLRRGQADRGLRGQHGAPGRPRRLHDDRPAAAASRAGSDALGAPLLRRPLLGLRLDRPAQRLYPGDGLQLQLRPQPVQPRRPGPPPAGLDLQDIRPDHGAEAGHRPLLRPTTSPNRSTSTCPNGATGTVHTADEGYLGSGQPPAGHGRLRQHGLRPARPRRRP